MLNSNINLLFVSVFNFWQLTWTLEHHGNQDQQSLRWHNELPKREKKAAIGWQWWMSYLSFPWSELRPMTAGRKENQSANWGFNLAICSSVWFHNLGHLQILEVELKASCSCQYHHAFPKSIWTQHCTSVDWITDFLLLLLRRAFCREKEKKELRMSHQNNLIL